MSIYCGCSVGIIYELGTVEYNTTIRHIGVRIVFVYYRIWFDYLISTKTIKDEMHP
jgi:hypothetical protein